MHPLSNQKNIQIIQLNLHLHILTFSKMLSKNANNDQYESFNNKSFKLQDILNESSHHKSAQENAMKSYSNFHLHIWTYQNCQPTNQPNTEVILWDLPNDYCLWSKRTTIFDRQDNRDKTGEPCYNERIIRTYFPIDS